jgi:hypothetical protein
MPEHCVRNRGTRIYLPPEHLRGLKVEAAKEDRSVSDIIRELVAGFLAKREREASRG